MPDDKSITPHLGPRVERLEDVTSTIDGRVQEIEKRLAKGDVYLSQIRDDLKGIRENLKLLLEIDKKLKEINGHEKRVSSLEQTRHWAARLVVGGFIVGMMGLVWNFK